MNKLYNTEWHFSLIFVTIFKACFLSSFLNQQTILLCMTICAQKTQIFRFTNSDDHMIRLTFFTGKLYSGLILFSNEFIQNCWIYANFYIILTANGQVISEYLFDALNFPKKQLKNLMNFCPRI